MLVASSAGYVVLDECMVGQADSLKGFMCSDLNMTMSWEMWQDGVAPCIVSSSITWLRGTCLVRKVDRLLCGKELLNLQGFDARLEGKQGVSSLRESWSI